MDKQAQDRCHRIGQEKTVHIYRLISNNTIEENIFKKSLQKRELGGLIIEGNFDPDFFKKVNYKEILEEGNIIKPEKMNIIQEEDIRFDSGGLDGAKYDKVSAEADRKKYEDVLIRIEDQEDVEAYQQAKHEVDDEFEDDIGGSPTNRSSTVAGDDKHSEKKEKSEHQDDASRTLSGVKRYESIDWLGHPKLDAITKRGIKMVKERYSFTDFMHEKSEKDSTFIDPEEEYKQQREKEEAELDQDEERSESSEVSEDRENYDPSHAMELYQIAQQQVLAINQ